MQEGIRSVRASLDLSRVVVSFDEPSLVPSAGLLPAALMAPRVGLSSLVEQRLTLARHGANSGAKALTVIASMLAGGDSIDDTGLLRAVALSTENVEKLKKPTGRPSLRAKFGFTSLVIASFGFICFGIGTYQGTGAHVSTGRAHVGAGQASVGSTVGLTVS